MKKIKISELPLYQSLVGLFVMGTDVNNRSVKVNLEFIESETTKAVKDADTATAAAAKAAGLADEATKTANAAALRADTAQAQAAKAAKAASDAAQSALSAKTQADDAAKAAQDAAEAAQAAKTAADEATTLTKAATEASEKATDKVLDTLGKIVPTGLSVESVPRLTLGNVNPVYLKAVLSPDTALKNLIYISDNRAVEVGLDGRISILNKGVSRVHIIPTCNTALARTVLIEVGEPTLRLVTTRRQMRFTQSGALRMN